MLRVLAKAILVVLVAGGLAACGGGSGHHGETAGVDQVAPYEAIDYQIIDLPTDVRPLYSSWSPDGKHIVFGNIMDGAIWMVGADGSDLTCVTCSMTDVPKIYSAFSYIFPDHKRLFVSNELGDVAYVVECSPSVVQCDHSQALPIDLSADEASDPRKQNLGRRTYHLAPDGVHLGYTMTRPDTMVMLIGKLVRGDSQYTLEDIKVINPPGPTGPDDENVAGWAHASHMFELKSFADGGASVLIVDEPSAGNPDTFKLDLASGAMVPMASSPDWDEDGAVSPNGRYLALASWRGMGRLEDFGLMPLSKGFFNYPLFAVIAFYHVSHWAGFQCDLQPWLLPGGGDDHGKLFGQPLVPYQGGDIIAANNLSGQPFWSPDSTRILLREHTTEVPPADANEELKVKGIPPHRLLIARLDREPSPPEKAVETRVGDWASTPEQYTGVFASPQTVFIHGSHGGTIEVVYTGTLLSANDMATYTNYSEDGEHFLSGTTTLTGSVYASLNYQSDLTVTDKDGKQVGSQVGEVQFTSDPSADYTQLPWHMTSTLKTTYEGKTAPPLATAGACIDDLPKPAPLTVVYQKQDGKLQVLVTADIHGDERPVHGAEVVIGGEKQKTDDAGTALISMPHAAPFTIRVTAGDTFLPRDTTVSEMP